MNLFFVGSDFRILCLQGGQLFVQLHTLTSGSIGNALFKISNSGAVTSLLLMHIIGTDTGNGVWLISMHIDQRLEPILLAAIKQPINRAFLINLAMLFIKIIQEIIPNYIFRLTLATQCIGNEFQVFIQCLCTVNRFHEFHEQTNNIILKIFIIANRDNVVGIRCKRSWNPFSIFPNTIVFPRGTPCPAAMN